MDSENNKTQEAEELRDVVLGEDGQGQIDEESQQAK